MAITGKPKELCLQALAAAQNIPDVAFEFLMSGHIPQASSQQQELDPYGEEDMPGEADGGSGMGGLEGYNLDPATITAI